MVPFVDWLVAKFYAMTTLIGSCACRNTATDNSETPSGRKGQGTDHERDKTFSDFWYGPW